MDGDSPSNLIIAGVNKAGTTSLFMYLSAHPDICPSNVKEVQHFLPLRYGAEELPAIEEYLRYFVSCEAEKYMMEATGGYFYGGASVAEAIKDYLGEPKIILIFRNPVDRLFSFYKFKKSMLELDQHLSFEEYVRLCEDMPPAERRKRENNVYWGIEGGFYADYLADWFKVFGEEDLKILFFEHLRRDPTSLLRDLCEWLGIECSQFIASLELSIENRTVNYKSRFLQKLALYTNWQGETFWRSHPRLKRSLRRIYYAINEAPHRETISDDMQAFLESVFSPYNERLAVELSGRGYTDLPRWLKQESESVAVSIPTTAR